MSQIKRKKSSRPILKTKRKSPDEEANRRGILFTAKNLFRRRRRKKLTNISAADERTKKITDAVARLIQFERWYEQASCSSKNGGVDESGACMENLLKTGSVTDGMSLLLNQQSQEYIKHHSKKTFQRATKKSGQYLCCFKKNSRKKMKLSLEREVNALEKEAGNLIFIIMYARRHITDLKKEHRDVRKKLHRKWYENNIIRLERDSLVRQINIAREKRDWLGSITRSIEAELEVLKEEREALKLEVENLRRHCKDAATLEESLNTVREYRDEPSEGSIQQEVDLVLESERPEWYTKAIKVSGAFKLKTNELRGQCKDAAALKEQLNFATVQRPKLRKGRIALAVTVIILVLCFSVRLFWTLRDPLNNCGTLFASPRKTSPYRNFISATTVPSRIIIV